MTSTPLANFPLDCWIQTLEYLPTRDLDNLSRVSRDTRASTEAFLYRSIHWDWKNPPIHKIMLLLRTISERPELAYYVWHVSLVWWDVEQSSKETGVFIPKGNIDWTKITLQCRPALRWARKVVRDAKFPEKLHAKLLARLFHGDAYFYATLLVSQLHNLRSLRLDFSFVLEGGFPGEMLHHSLFGNAPPGVLTRFSRLEMVDYGSNSPLTELNYRNNSNLHGSYQFMPWFHLPSLKILEIWLHNVEGICVFSRQMPKTSLNLSNLRSLVIAKSSVLAADIARLLSQVPYLESLHLGMGYQCREIAEFFKEPERLLRSLETSSQTMKHLSLGLELLPCCTETFRLRVTNGTGGNPFHGILNKFPKLQTASLPLNFLTGWETTAYELQDVLPPTLEALHIRSDLWRNSGLIEFELETLKALKLFLRHKENGTHPLLRTFSYPKQHEYDEDEIHALGLEASFDFLVQREAIHLFSFRRGYKVFSRYDDCAPGFMLKSATCVDNVVYWLPWPFVRVDELPASMPRESISTFSNPRDSTDANLPDLESIDSN
ncbi:uncharacterized protein N7479_003808 [Penicillium vulpinum]|uniref:F-box domain-containing protein n=1 Tax=Penicillium vulpinum TaxID=29845 RepID=A0A1V6RFI4_9EURO|nr:uncharacterized protein N7479_003808 [Penicillium vulpinum]KAJ5963932.1 hypothetical protein N7479_003808 [Penicillium vulpinum]OQE00552.1 hypothetical protein PENVUL_c050G03208 [Penicillium vulpinum]